MAVAEDPSRPADRAISDLHRRYARWLAATIRRRGVEGAEDVVQETFLRASAYDADALLRHPRALLIKIARSVVANTVRDASRKKRDPTGYSPPEWHYADQYQHVLLAETVSAIPEPYRDTFLLSRFEGMTYPEIADAQGISVKVVEWRVTQALAFCEKRLRD